MRDEMTTWEALTSTLACVFGLFAIVSLFSGCFLGDPFLPLVVILYGFGFR